MSSIVKSKTGQESLQLTAATPSLVVPQMGRPRQTQSKNNKTFEELTYNHTATESTKWFKWTKLGYFINLGENKQAGDFVSDYEREKSDFKAIEPICSANNFKQL